MEEQTQKFRKSLPDLKLKLEKERKKRFKEDEEYKKRKIKEIKNKKFDGELLIDVPNIDLRGKKSLYIKGECYTVDYCLDSFFTSLEPME